jgi:hypothetical protein
MDAASDWVASNGMALDFDGSDDTGRIPFSFPGFPFTISGHVLTRSNTTNQYAFALCNSASNDGQFAVLLGGAIAGDLVYARQEDSLGVVVAATSASSFEINKWFHIAAVYYSDSKRQIYVNGIAGNENTTASTTATINRFSLGILDRPSASSPLNGQLDDVRIYNRALTVPEIRRLASGRGVGLKPTSPKFNYLETREKTYSVVVKSQQEHSSLSEGLVGAWCPSLGASGYRLVDRSGYGNHGTLTNMDAATDWVSSNGVALDFDGSDDFVDNNPWTTNIGTGNFSVSAWVKTSSATRQAILAAYDGDSPDQGMIFDILNTGKVRCSAIGPNSATNLIFSDGNTSVDTGAWVHVCGVRTSSAMAIYVNGKLDTASTTSLGNPNVSITGSHRIGLTRSDAGYSAPFNGQIDDVRVYTRALTPPEIRQLASRRGIGLQPRPKQFTYYQFPSGSKRRRILTGMT